MEYNNQHHKYTQCLSIFFDLIGVRQRHLCLGVLTCCLSGGIIIAEFQQPSPFYTGYWMGSGILVTALFMLLCALKPSKLLLIASAMLDAAAIAITFAGSFRLLALTAETVYTAGWIGLATCVFLAYHCASCIYDNGACCKWKNANEVNTTSTTANTDELQAEEATGQEGREGRRRRRRTQSPPIDFRLPDEMPKLPEYEELSKSEGLPPAYNSLNIAPPEYTPPLTEVTINDESRI
ncbi:unnamed protein product [Hymenolepis diminuta]|uniref:DUF4203 domain-containing protein n=1 Tax=Hymenolepis diminuta TaxID=6216 RepID=A0A0R3SDM6_HYMDI|nr:unnamed protein product [Hymenolepis diminuta]VUZ41493.1 unnamed protein product [Hymenolepis diminuta]